MSDKIYCSDERSLENKSTWTKKFETNLKSNIAFATQTLLAPAKKKKKNKSLLLTLNNKISFALIILSHFFAFV